ncbi:MAG: outer membrane protein transport protein [Elusimicrobiota bacterium]
MKKISKIILVAMLASNFAYATNGDNMIGVGPTSRAMGGIGIAKAQDSISSVFANPATLTQIDGDQFNFAGTYFMPTVKADVKTATPLGTWKHKSQDAAYAIPAIGLSHKINDKYVFGIGAYGVSGMGVDYRNIDTAAQMNTKLSVMKFVPALAYKNGAFSYGLGLDIDYQAADFGAGLSHNYALGARLGANYEYGKWNFGLVYVTPQNVKHERVYDFDGLGGPTSTFNGYDDLKLENPAQYGFGISHKCTDKLTSSVEVKYLDWENADGYKDFDWESQVVYAFGLNYKATDKFSLRAGWNYGKNPVKKHDNFNMTGNTVVQGKTMNTLNYEYFRVIGFPAIVENHITFGFGYEMSQRVSLNMGYKHAFEKTLKENFAAGSIESKLSEDAVDFGLTFKF